VSVHLKPTHAIGVEIGEDAIGILHVVMDKDVPEEGMRTFARHLRKNIKLPKGVQAIVTTDQVKINFIRIGTKKKKGRVKK